MMAAQWSYDPSKFSSTATGHTTGTSVGDRNLVRFLIGDTNINKQLFYDEEIDVMVSQEANVYLAAAALVDILLIKAGGGIAKKTIGKLSIEYQTIMNFTRLAASLRARGLTHQIPYAGGIDVGDKLANEADSTVARPSISRRLGDNPGAPEPGRVTNPLTDL
jgi:hypothetical protein